MNSEQLYLFYEDLVRTLRDRGVVCAITSGLACVHYGIAETTKDCDLLCHGASFETLLELLSETRIENVACAYRGNISPPLDAGWHRGGWTSHFEWQIQPQPVKLDVFGHALRESAPWFEDIIGLYAGAQTVAEMKRTNRDKDWPFITALGERMIDVDDERGWLHIFNPDTLAELLQQHACPAQIAAQRPALKLAMNHDSRTAGALVVEREFWRELDRRRIQILEKHLRPYVSAVRRARVGKVLSLRDEHQVRVDCATRHLPMNPLKEYGLQKYFDDARKRIAESGFVPEALQWLPDVAPYFEWLNK